MINREIRHAESCFPLFVMAEPIYLNYGQNQIDLLAFLEAAANNVQNYVALQPWSNKRKRLFMEAYSDIMSKGVTGASNANGIWSVRYNNGQIDLASKSKKEQEMYGEAAYFIQLQMNGLTPKEEDKKLSEIPVFSNSEFMSLLESQILSTKFGGRPNWQESWTNLDTRTNGIYSVAERLKILASQLKNLADEALKNPEKYNFEGSPYKDMDDFQRRIANVITNLNNNQGNLSLNKETIDALNELGIDPEKYFYTGANRMITLTNGRLMTLLEYNDLMAKLQLQSELNIPRESLTIISGINSNEESQGQNNGYVSRQLIGGNNNIKWETEDVSRIVAALGDIVALGGFWANVGGSAVSLVADTTADIADENINGWDVVKNLGRNLGWTAAGFIPGGKLGKIGENIVRWAPKLLVVLNDLNLLRDESSLKTWNKLTNMGTLKSEGLNSEDLKNVTYWVRAITGTTNTVKSTARDIKYSKARGTSGLEFDTKSGKKVKLSNKDVDEINSVGARKGQKEAEKLFKTKTGEDIADGLMKFSEEGTRKWFADTRSRFSDQRLSGESVVFRTPEQLRYFDLYNRDNGVSSWRPFWRKGTSSYWRHFDSSNSFNFDKVTNRFDPYRNETNSLSGGKPGATSGSGSAGTSASGSSSSSASSSSSTGVSSSTGSSATGRKTWEEISKEGSKWKMSDTQKEYKELLKKHSGNKLSLKAFKIGNGKVNSFQVKKLPTASEEGVLKIRINGKKETISFKNLENLRMKVLELLRTNRIKTSEHTGKFLRGLSTHGILKYGGTIDKQRIQRYKEFIKK